MWCHLPVGHHAHHICEHGWMQQPELMQWVPLSPTPNAFLFLLLGFVAAAPNSNVPARSHYKTMYSARRSLICTKPKTQSSQ